MMVLARAVVERSASILDRLVPGSFYLFIRQSPWTGEPGRQALCFRDRQVSLGPSERGCLQLLSSADDGG
jgi:hypothetical protein